MNSAALSLYRPAASLSWASLHNRIASHAFASTSQRAPSAWVRRTKALKQSKATRALAKARSMAHADDVAADLGIDQGSTPEVQTLTRKLQAVPIIQPPEETFNAVMKVVRQVRPRADQKSERAKAANKAARALDTLMKELAARLNAYISGFPHYDDLHPFERSMMDLSVGRSNYDRIVNNVDSLRKAVIQVSKSYALKASKVASKVEAERAEEAGCEMVRTVLVERGKPIMTELKNLSTTLRRVPQIDLYVPTIALVGAPNVGKSSLVNVLSSGTPEVCNYPFTTRSVKMGHFFVNSVRHQVTDTPGLLYREDGERNAMELLTLATLEYLPTAALFVFDLTEECGCSVQQQWQIRMELLQRYPHKLWIDVLSKADMLEEEFDAADEAGVQVVPGLDALPADAVQGVRWLKDAKRVSSVTEEGLDDLKEAVMQLMRAESWAKQVQAMQDRDTLTFNEA